MGWSPRRVDEEALATRAVEWGRMRAWFLGHLNQNLRVTPRQPIFLKLPR